MKFRVELTSESLKDLRAIASYISLDNPQRAESYIDEILDRIRSLKSMPERCAVAPESGRRGYKMHHLVFGHYRILFTAKKPDVIILRIIHGARLLDHEE